MKKISFNQFRRIISDVNSVQYARGYVVSLVPYCKNGAYYIGIRYGSRIENYITGKLTIESAISTLARNLKIEGHDLEYIIVAQYC